MDTDNQQTSLMEVYTRSIRSPTEYDEVSKSIKTGLQNLIQDMPSKPITLSRGTCDPNTPRVGHLYLYSQFGVIALTSGYDKSSISGDFKGGGFKVKAFPTSPDGVLSKKLSKLMSTSEFNMLDPQDKEYLLELDYI